MARGAGMSEASEGFAGLWAGLAKSDRRTVAGLAEEAEASVDAVLIEITAAYLRLLRDVPEALPRNPLEPIRSRAERDRAARGGCR